jgi:enolase
LDGTPQKEVLGANTVLGVSLAFSHALAASRRWPLFRLFQEEMGIADAKLKLPIPMMNIINGGAHANNGLSIQEFMIVPHGFDSFREALRAGCEIFQNLKTQLHEAHFSTGVGDEGGFAPDFEKNEEALEWIVRAIEKSGYKLGSQVSLALDVAASSFFSEKEQKYELNSGKWISTDQMIDYLILLAERFPIVSIEDGLYEDDWDGWKKLTQKLAKKIQLVGDDLFVTQKARLEKGISNQVANAILIKVNQVGTLKETFETMQAARASDYRQVVSHRSGETEDVTIAHLAVGSGAGQIKTGSLSRSERIAKYNELLRIEDDAQMTGRPISFALGYQ